MLLSIVKALYHFFYPLESSDARRRQRTSELRRAEKRRRTIQQTTRTATTSICPVNPKNALLGIKPSLLKPVSTRIRKHRCPGCGLRLSRDRKSLCYRRQKLPGLCSACKVILKFTKGEDLIQRLKQPKKRQDYKRHHEANFMQNLHKMQGGRGSVFSKVDLYHLPLSTNYYRKLNEKKFVHHSSYPNDNTVLHFNTCSGCRLFVSTRRKTLLHATQKARRRRENVGNSANTEVASVQDLFGMMVSSNSSCAFSGTRGVWHSFSKCARDPLCSLSLDHKVPLSKGGSSTIDNLQVTLVCLNSIKGSYSNRKFVKWWNAFRKKQGCF